MGSGDKNGCLRYPSDNANNKDIPMTFLKKAAVVFVFIIAAIFVDFRLADNAHKRILTNSADFQERLSAVEFDFNGPKKQGCKITRVYLVNAYQTCFVAWYGEPGDGIQGFTFVYHRPRPICLFYGQTSESRYFRYSEYGTRLKQVRKDGFINHLYRDGSEK